MENMSGVDRLKKLAGNFNPKKFQELHEEMSFAEYVNRVYQNPKLARSAYQRLYDMIMEAGSENVKRYDKTFVHYKFFDDPDCTIYGLTETIDQLVKFVRGAAGGYGTERRILLLHGPVGSAKSTICRVLKRGMERYSKTDAGAWYTFKWVNLPVGENGIYTHTEDNCPMREDPLKLLPPSVRDEMLKELNAILLESTPEADRNSQYTLKIEGDLDPRCKKFMEELLMRHSGDWSKVIENHIRVFRMSYSEADRVGIATFQPKDEKNQDATELTGDINYSKLPFYGSDSDPRAFNFDGEFCAANRGMCEFIEMLKLAQEFLYDLLGASQERNIKPKKFSQISVDEVLIGHTNGPEYEKLKANTAMEALRDRTVKIDVPYLLQWSDEIKVLYRDYNKDKVRQHIAPHTLEIAALWSILTRLVEDKDRKLSLVEKAKLYNGQQLAGWNEHAVKELRDKYPHEGMAGGISARYVQDKVANCLSSHFDYINPFMVINELRSGLEASSMIADEEMRTKYRNCIDMVMKELEEILKAEVQKALVGDENAIVRLCGNYIDNLMAYINKTKVTNPYTGLEQEPDERLMRSIEGKIEIPEQGADDFRRSMAGFIGSLSVQGKAFKWDSNPRLKKALEAKLFEDTKDHINLSKLHVAGSSVVDKDLQKKIDAVKQRLVDNFGYNQQSATDVLDFVSSIFARGDTASS